MHSRRNVGRILLGGLSAAKLFAQKVSGVQLGVCTYSFRSLPRSEAGDAVDTVIQALKECGADECELFSPQLEPAEPQPPSASGAAAARMRQDSPEAKKARLDLRRWRLDTPAEHFRGVREKFEKAGIRIFAYTMNFRADFTDEEIDKSFEQAIALGAHVIAASTQLSVAQRLAPFADKHRYMVALHGHSNVRDLNEFSSPDTFRKALEMSPWFRINLDIGHFTAANFDAVAFIEKEHEKITHIHMKDRKRNDGPNEPFGEGDTPIKQVLSLLQNKRYDIPAFIEYEYRGAGTPVEEVRKALAYERAALGG